MPHFSTQMHTLHACRKGNEVRLTSTMTLSEWVMRGCRNTQKISYRKHSGSRMEATCIPHSHISCQKRIYLYILLLHVFTCYLHLVCIY